MSGLRRIEAVRHPRNKGAHVAVARNAGAVTDGLKATTFDPVSGSKGFF